MVYWMLYEANNCPDARFGRLDTAYGNLAEAY